MTGRGFAQEIFNLWQEAESYTSDEVYGLIEEVIITLHEGADNIAKFRDEMTEYLQERLLESEECPNCHTKLESKGSTEYIGDYQGVPSYEEYNSNYCPQCGWEED